MDSGKGRFEMLEPGIATAHFTGALEKPNGAGGIFSIGDKVEIGGSRFRVRKITRKDLVLRLLPRGVKEEGHPEKMNRPRPWPGSPGKIQNGVN